MKAFDWSSLIGKKYGKLMVLGLDGKDKYGHPKVKCLCDCGNVVSIIATRVKTETTKSCGCYQKEMARKAKTTHGQTHTRLYRTYCGMVQRCYNPNARYYKIYGGRGITICEEWLNDYVSFMVWALNNGYRDDLSIDRIDVNGDYSPQNCKWSTWFEQANNTRRNRYITYKGETKTAKEWADLFGFNYKYFHEKLKKNNWSIDAVLEIDYFKEHLCN